MEHCSDVVSPGRPMYDHSLFLHLSRSDGQDSLLSLAMGLPFTTLMPSVLMYTKRFGSGIGAYS